MAWRDARADEIVRGRKSRPSNRPVILRGDPHVLEHYKATGKGWQSRMNAALRARMEGYGGVGEEGDEKAVKVRGELSP